MMECPVTAQIAAKRLGLSLPTLNRWLAEDERRLPANQLFQFHRMRGGQKRVWSEQGFAALEVAIDRESRPGGVLCHWRTRGRFAGFSDDDEDAASAMDAVSRFRA